MVIEQFGKETFNSFKDQADQLEQKFLLGAFNVFATAVQNWISANVANKVVQVTDTTKNQIKKITEKGQLEGQSINQIADEIDKLYLKQIIPNRSTVIARTEVISSSNAGSRFAAEQTDLPLEKVWISTKDDRTREAHEEVDGQTRAMNDPYEVMGEKLMFPADPKGSPENVIQCRCTEFYRVIKK